MLFITEEKELDFQKQDRQVAYFYRSSTPFHKKMIHMLEKAENKFGSDTDFFAIDLEFFKNFIQRFDLQQSPTVIFFENGKKIKRIKGVQATEEFLGIFDQVFSKKIQLPNKENKNGNPC
jgi:thioredoxin-like negative regulator of GroEL